LGNLPRQPRCINGELERRVRTVEEEARGKHLTRYAAEQACRNGEVLHALRTEVAAVRADVSGAAARGPRAKKFARAAESEYSPFGPAQTSSARASSWPSSSHQQITQIPHEFL
jgi:hypothetical protein